jgi:hypothetical protein
LQQKLFLERFSAIFFLTGFKNTKYYTEYSLQKNGADDVMPVLAGKENGHEQLEHTAGG